MAINIKIQKTFTESFLNLFDFYFFGHFAKPATPLINDPLRSHNANKHI